MEPVQRVSGTALPLGWDDVDTDQIVPSDALKRIERTGFGSSSSPSGGRTRSS
jgi:3-isopropylmalate/(R)-2-methylmalate dehydratase small subunit